MVKHLAKTDNDGQSVRSKLQDLELQNGPQHSVASSSYMMPLLNRCCCFSLITGACITGIYSTAVYIVAFAMELWLITEAKEQLPSPPYMLCVVYFITWITSVALLVGLALRRTQPILAWLLSIGLIFFPECGLVMFMSLFYWTLGTSFGTVELVFWIVRASLNILGTIQVFSLYSQWKEEKTVSRRLRDLSMHASPMSNGYYTNAVMKTPLPGSLRAGYHNAAYLSSTMNLRQMQQLGNNRLQVNAALISSDLNRMHQSLRRSASSLSHIRIDDQDGGKRLTKEEILNGFTVFDQWQQNKLGIPSTEQPGMAYGPMGIAGVGLDDSQLFSQPRSSLWFDDGDYLNRAPLSRAVSTLLLQNYPSNFTGPTFDRQSQFVIGSNSVTSRISVMRRAQSMCDLRPSEVSPDIKFGRIDRQPFDYVRPAGRMVRGESDDIQRSYKDVAL